MTSFLNKLVIRLVNYKLASDGKKVRRRLDKITYAPMETQERLLMQLLHDNKDTEYGRK